MRQSALHHWHLAAQAHLVEAAGWQAPAHYGDPEREAAAARAGAGLADLSNLTKVDVCAPAPPPAAGAACWVLGHRHYLLTGPPGQRAALAPYGIDVTSVLAAFLLAGPRSRDVLGKLSSLNLSDHSLRDGAAAQTSVARVHTTILRQDRRALPAFLLLAARDYAEYLWEALLQAGQECGLAPIGQEAAARLEE
jgi:glycine cleavage system aminomethyltransferase T